jgi:hypothetical protein
MSNSQPDRHTYSPAEASADESAEQIHDSEQIVDVDDAERAADSEQNRDNKENDR